MPHQVNPFSVNIATSARGTMLGNRGILQGGADWAGKHWICCLIDPRLRPKRPRKYTKLFFLDEAVALAAGHRPCHRCRKERLDSFAKAWCPAEPPSPDEMDEALHEERVGGRARQPRTLAARSQRRHDGWFEELPDGAFVVKDNEAWLVYGKRIHRYNSTGYDLVESLPHGPAKILTPPSIIKVLKTDYKPCLHPSVAALTDCN